MRCTFKYIVLRDEKHTLNANQYWQELWDGRISPCSNCAAVLKILGRFHHPVPRVRQEHSFAYNCSMDGGTTAIIKAGSVNDRPCTTIF